MSFNVKLNSETQDEISFECGEDELVLNAAKKQGVYLASYCKQGACGACAATLVSGSVSYIRGIKGAPEQPSVGDEVRSCSLKPCSDLILEPLASWRLAGD